MGSILINDELPLGVSNEKSSDFYFNPKIIANGKQYYQICTLVENIECYIMMKYENSLQEYFAVIVEITAENSNDPNTPFSKEPAI